MWDSVIYIGAARSLAHGSGLYMLGWLPRMPLTGWPPLYPLMLAVPAHFGIDPTVSAKWIDGFFLSCSIFLIGFIAWANCRRSYALGVLAALAIALSPDIIEIHSQVLSEAPFIAFVLAGISMLLSYANSGKNRYLIGLSIAFSAALLTRYSGVFFLIAVCVVVAVNWQNLKQRSVSLIGIGVASAVAVWPLGFWIIRNMLVNGSAVGHRKFVFHPPGQEQFLDLCRTVSRWFAPAVPRSLGALLLLAIVTAIAVIFASLFRSRRRSAEMFFNSTTLLAEVCLVFDAVYLIFLSLTICFLDASTVFDVRLLLPMFPITVLLLVSGLAIGRQKYGRHSIMYRTLLTVGFLIVVCNSVRFWTQIRDIRINGIGFQTLEWQDDEIIGYVRDLRTDTILYADNPLLVYFATGRASYYVPQKISITTKRANDEYPSQMRELLEIGASRKVDIILLNRPHLNLKELEERLGFHPILRSTRGNYVLSSRSDSDTIDHW